MQRRQFLTTLLLLTGLPAACRNLAGERTAPRAAWPDHPRLIATRADWQKLEQRRRADPELDAFVALLLERARADLKREPLERRLEGRRLLGVSREFIRRNLLWAFAFRVSGEGIFLDRARREMLSVAAFSDWHPEHYLDVAEMTAGMALGYDWLFDNLPADERLTIRRAIVTHGIAQARQGHKTFQLKNNWGQVCIGGMVLGALAIAEDEPELAADLLTAARQHAFIALEAYKPDGVYPEGPNYWSYGTSYETLLIAALRSAMHTDWGLLDVPGFRQSAFFYAQSTGPTGKQFNFADGGEGQELSPAIFYLSQVLKQPALAAAKRAMIPKRQGLNERFAPLIALWWPDAAANQTPPLHFSGQGPQPVAIWRSSWTDPNALYFAIKGGGAAHNHAHMDGGSFVLDLDGVRWAKDLGMQDYNSLESRGIDLWNMKQDSPRWKVFRLGNTAHNTLGIDDSLHRADGMATLSMHGDDEARIDLSPIFLHGQVSKATRVARIQGRQVELSDSILGAHPGSMIRWAMNTEAAVQIDGTRATLSLGNKRLNLDFSGSPVSLEVLDISRPRADYDQPNPNTHQLIARGPAAADGSWRLKVDFSGG